MLVDTRYQPTKQYYMLNLPHFIHIGFPKTASTWLQDFFSSHPEICFVLKPKFFQRDDYFKKGKEFYLSLFQSERGHKITGEGDETYSVGGHSSFDGIAQRIHQTLPEAKIIIVIRNQVDWLSSLYKHKVRKGRPWSFKKFLNSSSGKEYISAGFYSTTLELYFKLFGRENVLVLFYEELENNPSEFLNKISNFLGISKFDYSRADKRIKVSLTNRGAKIKQKINYINRIGFCHKYLKRFIMYIDRKLLMRLKDVELISREEKLAIRNLYAEDNKKLIKLVGYGKFYSK